MRYEIVMQGTGLELFIAKYKISQNLSEDFGLFYVIPCYFNRNVLAIPTYDTVKPI